MRTIKEPIAQKILSIAKKEFNFNFSLIFYDVTTLYFESDRGDDFRKPGFSKDNKFHQPQIVLGLIVTKKGFPLWYQIFEGNKFEGHTLIPIINDFKKKHKIDTITVVADAAMISSENIRLLSSASLNYIVGARLANLRLSLIKTVSIKLNRSDGMTIRVKTELGDLICEYSEKRYRKDKREMDNYIKKAESLIKEPGKIKRAKYVKVQNQSYQLNKPLIEKNELLLGIKGYYTNLEQSEVEDKTIIEHYHNLWQIEHAFRITKSDLQIRPIYHRKKEIIEVHVLICFMALAVCKYIKDRKLAYAQAVTSPWSELFGFDLFIDIENIISNLSFSDFCSFISYVNYDLTTNHNNDLVIYYFASQFYLDSLNPPNGNLSSYAILTSLNLIKPDAFVFVIDSYKDITKVKNYLIQFINNYHPDFIVILYSTINSFSDQSQEYDFKFNDVVCELEELNKSVAQTDCQIKLIEACKENWEHTIFETIINNYSYEN